MTIAYVLTSVKRIDRDPLPIQSDVSVGSGVSKEDGLGSTVYSK